MINPIRENSYENWIKEDREEFLHEVYTKKYIRWKTERKVEQKNVILRISGSTSKNKG